MVLSHCCYSWDALVSHSPLIHSVRLRPTREDLLRRVDDLSDHRERWSTELHGAVEVVAYRLFEDIVTKASLSRLAVCAPLVEVGIQITKELSLKLGNKRRHQPVVCRLIVMSGCNSVLILIIYNMDDGVARDVASRMQS